MHQFINLQTDSFYRSLQDLRYLKIKIPGMKPLKICVNPIIISVTRLLLWWSDHEYIFRYIKYYIFERCELNYINIVFNISRINWQFFSLLCSNFKFCELTILFKTMFSEKKIMDPKIVGIVFTVVYLSVVLPATSIKLVTRGNFCN